MNSEQNNYCYKYPHPSITTDCVIFALDSNSWKLLLIKRANTPYKGYWAFPGGFLNIDESADLGAKRELFEETGIKIDQLKQFHAFTNPQRDPRERIVSIAYYSLIRSVPVCGGDDADKAVWYDLHNLPQLAFDHHKILEIAALDLLREISYPSHEFREVLSKFNESELVKLKDDLMGLRI